VYNDGMYVLGGSDDDGERHNDFWRLDLNTWTWSRVQENGDIPEARSGHTTIVFSDALVLFGGI
jgi:hypothetical protein